MHTSHRVNNGQGIDEHLGEITISGIKTFTSDHLGTVVNGEIVTGKKTTGAFGEVLSTINPIETTSNPTLYGYTGRQLDVETGHYYYRNRYYDPQSGRFLSKDPKGIDGGDVNLYRYVQNSPLLLTDPYGENPVILKILLDVAQGVLGLTKVSIARGKGGGSDLNAGEDKALMDIKNQQYRERTGIDKLPSPPVVNYSIELKTSIDSRPQLRKGGPCP